jgi:hypothetical protein
LSEGRRKRRRRTSSLPPPPPPPQRAVRPGDCNLYGEEKRVGASRQATAVRFR